MIQILNIYLYTIKVNLKKKNILYFRCNSSVERCNRKLQIPGMILKVLLYMYSQ